MHDLACRNVHYLVHLRRASRPALPFSFQQNHNDEPLHLCVDLHACKLCLLMNGRVMHAAYVLPSFFLLKTPDMTAL